MSKISLTVKQIIELGLWEKVCEFKGIEPYAFNEGLIRADTIINFDSTFEKMEKEIEFGKEYIRKSTVYCITNKIDVNYNNDIYTKFILVKRNLENNTIDITLEDFEAIEHILDYEKY